MSKDPERPNFNMIRVRPARNYEEKSIDILFLCLMNGDDFLKIDTLPANMIQATINPTNFNTIIITEKRNIEDDKQKMMNFMYEWGYIDSVDIHEWGNNDSVDIHEFRRIIDVTSDAFKESIKKEVSELDEDTLEWFLQKTQKLEQRAADGEMRSVGYSRSSFDEEPRERSRPSGPGQSGPVLVGPNLSGPGPSEPELKRAQNNPLPFNTINEFIEAVFDKINNSDSIHEFITNLPLNQFNYVNFKTREINNLIQKIDASQHTVNGFNVQVQAVTEASRNFHQSSVQHKNLVSQYNSMKAQYDKSVKKHKDLQSTLETMINDQDLSDTSSNNEFLEYINQKEEIDIHDFKEIIDIILKNIPSIKDREMFEDYLFIYIGRSPPTRQVAPDNTQMNISPPQVQASPVHAPPGPQVQASPGPPVHAPPGPVQARETKEEKQDREAKELEKKMEKRAINKRRIAADAFSVVIPGLEGTDSEGTSYKELFEDSWTIMNPKDNCMMGGVHYAKQRDLPATLRVLQAYYEKNSERLGTNPYKHDIITTDLENWLSLDSEFSTVSVKEEGFGTLPPITRQTRKKMVGRLMSCVDSQRTLNGTTDKNINVTPPVLLNLIYTFVKGQDNSKFRSGFAAEWVKFVMHTYTERDKETQQITQGLTIFTYHLHENPHGHMVTSCDPGTVHLLLPAFNATLSRVFGESAPEMTPEEKQLADKRDQTCKINYWFQISSTNENSDYKSSQEFINERIQEEGGNPKEWRVTVNDKEYTVKEFVKSMYTSFGDDVSPNPVSHESAAPPVTKSSAPSHQSLMQRPVAAEAALKNIAPPPSEQEKDDSEFARLLQEQEDEALAREFQNENYGGRRIRRKTKQTKRKKTKQTKRKNILLGTKQQTRRK